MEVVFEDDDFKIKFEHSDLDIKLEPIIMESQVTKIDKEETPNSKESSCRQCQRPIGHMSTYKIKRHYATHKYANKSLECSDCPRKFSNLLNLEIHMKTHTGNLFKCKHCQKKFARIENLRNHERVHTNDLFECNICKKRFVWDNSLRLHISKHFLKQPVKNKQKSFSCVFCNKTYSRERDLQLHAIVHFKKHPYKCNECGKTYFRQSSLARHLRNHSIKAFSCNICSRKFTRKYLCEDHIRKHSSNLECNFCLRFFTSKSSIEEHIIEKHLNIKDSFYYCSHCFKIFPYNIYARRHKVCSGHNNAVIKIVKVSANEKKVALKYNLLRFDDIKLLVTPNVVLFRRNKNSVYF